MPFSFVPDEHLEHVLELAMRRAALSTKQRAALRTKLRSPDDGENQEALAFIEKQLPGRLAELDDIWCFRSPRAMLLWRLPYLEGVSVREALNEHPQLRRGWKHGIGWHDVPGERGSKASVRKVRADDATIETEVFLTKTSTVEFEGEEDRRFRTERVSVRIDFSREEMLPVAEVTVSFADARNALFATLDWLRGEPTPRRKSPAQEELLEPVKFTEAQVAKMAARLGWGLPTGLRGRSASRICGDIQFHGEKQGIVPKQLDPAKHELIKLQLAAPNAKRHHAVRVEHADGFEETTQVGFVFSEAQPNISFLMKTSRVAMDFVVTELRNELKL